MNKRCYIVGAGEFYGSISPKATDLVIAADGGLVHLERVGIRPNVLLGDFDSLSLDCVTENGIRSQILAVKSDTDAGFDDLSWIKSVASEIDNQVSGNDGKDIVNEGNNASKTAIPQIIGYPVMKDETDMFLAYKIGVERGFREFLIYGGVGGREDHTFANYCLLSYAKKEGNSAYLYGNGYRVFALKNETVNLCGKKGMSVSVFAFGGDARGVSIRGLKYEAESITLKADFPLGVSNSYTEEGRGEISVSDGTLLVIEEIENKAEFENKSY